MSLKSFYRNPFKATTITVERLVKFCKDHLERLTAYNVDDALTATINETTPLLNALNAAVNAEDTSAVTQLSLTQKMTATLKAFKKDVSRDEGLIRHTWGAGTPEYRQFFPNGVSEYSTASLTDAEILMSRFVSSATAHVATLGQAFADKFSAHLSNFSAARKAQLQQFGEVSEAKADVREKREAMETQLLKNIHTLGTQFTANGNRSMNFFDESLLRRSKRTKVETPPAE